MTRLERVLGHQFADRSLLELALTHRSYSNRNNERLEFLGDAILSFVIADKLYERFPEAGEGQLSRLRARLVKGVTLAEVAREMGLGDFLRLGSGELKSGGFNRKSILADALEALIGAIYLDAGVEAARERILTWFHPRLSGLTLEDTLKDAKTRLQEYLQARKLELPSYHLVCVEGEAHAQIFHVECRVAPLDEAVPGSGRSRRIAEQAAAQAALKALGVDP